MNVYIPIEQVAVTLSISEPELKEFSRLGWIRPISNDKAVYLREHDEYRLRYILALRNRELTNEQIDRVLRLQSPPYRLSDVDELLAAEIDSEKA
ncbi:MAG: MerR family transcriptional regulator [Bryobacteraceae bacterium]